jgi:hypothetical protein
MRKKKLLSDEHFSVDGTLLEACSSHKCFRAKDGRGKDPSDDDRGSPTVDFHGGAAARSRVDAVDLYPGAQLLA